MRVAVSNSRVDSTQTNLPACGKTIPAIYNSGSGYPCRAIIDEIDMLRWP